MLLSVVGPVSYKLLRNLLAPAKPGEKTYGELVATLSAHYSPAPSEIIQRFKFHSHIRNPGESVATYVAELCSLAEYCNFGQTLEAMLHDRIVCGINDDAIQRHLLTELGLTFKKSLEIAQSLEATARHMRELHPAAAGSSKRETNTSSKEINKLTQQNPTQSKSEATCCHCGKPGQKPANCCYKEATLSFLW